MEYRIISFVSGVNQDKISSPNTNDIKIYEMDLRFNLMNTILLNYIILYFICIVESQDKSLLPPKIQISLLIRNKGYALPYFLGNLERLKYRKDRIGLFIRIDHSVDDSSTILESWLEHVESEYHHVDYNKSSEGQGFLNEKSVTQWTKKRYENVIIVREEGLNSGRKAWADYLLMIDADVMIINEDMIEKLISHGVPVVSPMLNCTNSAVYSNFWGDMTESGYYKRSKDYFDIQRRKKKGIFKVPVIHSVYFINLNLEITKELSFLPNTDEKFPIDDIILFAKSAEKHGVDFFIDNTDFYGYFISPDDDGGFNNEKKMFQHAKFQIMLDLEDRKDLYTLKTSKYIKENIPMKSKLGFDEIYLVNLKRRNDRRTKMEYLFEQLGIDAKYFEAVDGKSLNKTYLEMLQIKQMHGYSDPYHKRDLKMGEIGCFLSHYFIWLEVIAKNYEKILIFEDDIRFEPGFLDNLEIVMEETERVKPNWELLYLGRKRLSDEEAYVEGSSHLVYPEYTYWTLGYAINTKGVKKLIDQQPLMKMLAVDEYLPIMFNRHPQESWKKYFEPRDLVAISAQPLLLEPTHYTGEPKYVSDTEDSIIIDDLK